MTLAPIFHGYRPQWGNVDRDGNEIEDRIYNTKDFDRYARH
jgi:type I restriction enzyme R subunit